MKHSVHSKVLASHDLGNWGREKQASVSLHLRQSCRRRFLTLNWGQGHFDDSIPLLNGALIVEVTAKRLHNNLP